MATASKMSPEVVELLKLRDEIRLQIHLAGMEAKTAWRNLEPKLEELERQAASEGSTVKTATRELARDLKKALEQFRARISA